MTSTVFPRLVSSIYEAVLAPDGWAAPLDAITETLGATGSALVLADHRDRDILCARVPDDASRSYVEHYRHHDYVLAEVERSPVGMLLSGARLVALGTGTEFDTDFLRPHEMQDGLFVRLNVGPPIMTFLVAAAKRRALFDSPDRVSLVNALVPHLQRALRIGNRLDGLSRLALDAVSAVDAMRHGAIFLDERGRVLHANLAARSILSCADGLTLHGDMLTAVNDGAATELSAAVAKAVGRRIDLAPAASALLCPRLGGQSFIVHVTPQPRGSQAGKPNVRAMVLVIDPGSNEPPIVLLCNLFGLTPAEVDVALRLARGDALKAITEDLTVSMTTVKTHLRNLFAKTGTHRQAELVRMLLTVSG